MIEDNKSISCGAVQAIHAGNVVKVETILEADHVAEIMLLAAQNLKNDESLSDSLRLVAERMAAADIGNGITIISPVGGGRIKLSPLSETDED